MPIELNYRTNYRNDAPCKLVKFSKLALNVQSHRLRSGDEWGDLRVYFDKQVTLDELECIFGCSTLKEGLQSFLRAKGITPEALVESESGLQTRFYLNFEVGQLFIDSWRAKYGDREVVEL